MTKHCCDVMNDCIADAGIPLFYSKIKRRYYMPNIYQHRSQSIQGLYACPWCAMILPKDLGDDYYSISDFACGDKPEFRVPEEYMHTEKYCCNATVNDHKNHNFLKQVVSRPLHGKRPHNHCCDMMAIIIDHAGIPLLYSKILRKYHMIRMIKHVIVDYVVFAYCPWCVKVLPKDLTVEYNEIVQRECGINTREIDITCEFDLPEEFKSDEWWKKRGL